MGAQTPELPPRQALPPLTDYDPAQALACLREYACADELILRGRNIGSNASDEMRQFMTGILLGHEQAGQMVVAEKKQRNTIVAPPQDAHAEKIAAVAKGAGVMASLVSQYVKLSLADAAPPYDFLEPLMTAYGNDYAAFAAMRIRRSHITAGRQSEAAYQALLEQYADDPEVPAYIVREAFVDDSRNPEGYVLRYRTRVAMALDAIIPGLRKEFGVTYEPPLATVTMHCCNSPNNYAYKLRALYEGVAPKQQQAGGPERPIPPDDARDPEATEYHDESAKKFFERMLAASRDSSTHIGGRITTADATITLTYLEKALGGDSRYKDCDLEQAVTYAVKTIKHYNKTHPDNCLEDNMAKRVSLAQSYLGNVLAMMDARAYEPYHAAAYQTPDVYDTMRKRFPGLTENTYQLALSAQPRNPLRRLEKAMARRSNLSQ